MINELEQSGRTARLVAVLTAALSAGVAFSVPPVGGQGEGRETPVAEAPLYDITGPKNLCGKLDSVPSKGDQATTGLTFLSSIPGFSVGWKDNDGEFIISRELPQDVSINFPRLPTTQVWFVTDGDGNCVWAGYPTEEPAKVEVREPRIIAAQPTGRTEEVVEEEPVTESKFIDVTALPGWPSRSPEVFTRLKDGSVQVTSGDTSSEMRLLNRTDTIEIGDGLELFVKMNAVSKADPNSPRTSQIILFDNQLATEMGFSAPVELHIGFDRNGYLTLAMLDLNQEDWTQRLKYFLTPQHGKKLSSDKLRIEIVKTGQEMMLNIFDAPTDNLLVGGFRPPVTFLDNNLNLGFYPQAGDRNGVILTVNALKIRLLTEDLA